MLKLEYITFLVRRLLPDHQAGQISAVGGGFQGGTLRVLGDRLRNMWGGGMDQRRRSIIQQWVQVQQLPQGLEQELVKAKWLHRLHNRRVRGGAGLIKALALSYWKIKKIILIDARIGYP